MGSHCRDILRLFIGLILAAGCGESTSPMQSAESVTIVPGTQWAGGVAIARSTGFTNLELVGATDSEGNIRPDRWENLAISVDGDTLDSWRAAPDEVAFRLPNPLQSGTLEVRVAWEGVDPSTTTINVVGSAHPVRTIQCSATAPCTLPTGEHYYHGEGVGAGRLFSFVQDGAESGMAIVTLEGPVPTVRWLPDLSAANLPGLVAPGAAINPGQWIADVSSPDMAVQPMVWDLGPSLNMARSLACLPEGIDGAYSLVELRTDDCLVLLDSGFHQPGSLTLNGTIVVPGYDAIPWGWTAGCAGFRSSGGHRWITLRSMRGDWFCDQGDPAGLPAWPVFDGDGNLAYSSSRYSEWVRGADFTPTGDTLWVVGNAAGWSLDAWDASSAELLSETPLEDFARCEDLLLDPLRSYVYAACYRTSAEGSAALWPSLVIYDRSDVEIVATLDTDLGDHFPYTPRPPFLLVYGGSSGQIHLTAVWDGTTAPRERGMMVATFDTF